jgi:hypothetical protein
VADIERGKAGGELVPDTVPELLIDQAFRGVRNKKGGSPGKKRAG